jgi:hypothetical protein
LDLLFSFRDRHGFKLSAVLLPNSYLLYFSLPNGE